MTSLEDILMKKDTIEWPLANGLKNLSYVSRERGRWCIYAIVILRKCEAEGWFNFNLSRTVLKCCSGQL